MLPLGDHPSEVGSEQLSDRPCFIGPTHALLLVMPFERGSRGRESRPRVGAVLCQIGVRTMMSVT